MNRRALHLLLAAASFLWACKSNDPPKDSPPTAIAQPRPPVVARLQAGRFKVGANEGGENVVVREVKFPEPFVRPPIVVVEPVHFDPHPDVISTTVANTTATGFQLLLHRTDQPVAGWGLDLNVDWIAVDYGGGTANLLGGP